MALFLVKVLDRRPPLDVELWQRSRALCHRGGVRRATRARRRGVPSAYGRETPPQDDRVATRAVVSWMPGSPGTPTTGSPLAHVTGR